MPPLKDLFPRAAALFFGRHGPFPMPSGLPQTTASEDPRTDGVFQVVSDHGTRLPTMDHAFALALNEDAHGPDTNVVYAGASTARAIKQRISPSHGENRRSSP
jgi:hypothetical protein